MGGARCVTSKRYYCTYFDHRYLARAQVMLQSLKQHSDGPLHLWALCMTDEAYDALVRLRLADVTAVHLRELESADPELLAVKPTRSAVEYYFTCSPALPLYLLEHNPGIDVLTYLDADLCFYSSPEPLFDELGSGSVAITAHRFPADLLYLEDRGVYNVAWCSFRSDSNGLAVLRLWREQCLDWCYDRLENGRYGDQKYLDTWPAMPGVVVLSHPGANLAPWNLRRHTLSYDRALRSDGQPLIFYHFSGLKRDARWFYDLNLHIYGVARSRVTVHRLYRPYVSALVRTTRDLAALPGVAKHDTVRDARERSFARSLLRQLRSVSNVVRGRSVLAR
jgi:hypothetical protein